MNFYRPTSLTQALEIRARTGARILAGGTDIYPNLSGPELRGEVLDITAVPDLKRIYKAGNGWHIGATCTWSQVAAAKLPPGFAALQHAAGKVGSVQIQNAGTVGGNLCNASPAADGVPPLLVLDAVVEITSIHGKRQVQLCDFIQGVRKIDLQQDEIVTGLNIPMLKEGGGAAFEKLGARNHLVISISMVAVWLAVESGKISEIAIAVGSSSPVSRRLVNLEKLILGCNINDLNSVADFIKAQVEIDLSPIDDIRADAKFRDIAASELIHRAIKRAVEEAIL